MDYNYNFINISTIVDYKRQKKCLNSPLLEQKRN